jgi:uncharacterized membrane-anchored protein
MAKLVRVLGVVCALTSSAAGVAQAQLAADSAAAPADQAAPADSAVAGDAAPEGGSKIPWQPGPKAIDLSHGAKLDLPESHAFLAMPEAGKLMEKMGNLYNEDLLGLVVSKNEADEYIVTLRYEESGYIKDDEELDGKELLESIQEGEEEYNEERKKLGFSAIHAAGWDEEPHYDKRKHELIWGLRIEASDGGSINYNTRILGRSGFISLNLVTDKQHLAEYKPAGALLLSKTAFEAGKRYADFNSSTDKVAEYGLTGLVLGGAGLGLAKAAKIGLLAKFSKVIIGLLVAGKKLIVVAALAIGAALKALFKKNDERPT